MRDVSSLGFFRALPRGFAVTSACLRGAFAAAAALIALGACGSDESGDASDGKCSPAGATQSCTGPGACAGGQVCLADGTWGPCDCGGTGGGGAGGATGGSSGSGGASGDGSTSTGGAASDASTDGAGGGTQWTDDPCPSITPLIDCSTSCGGPSASCAQATCPDYYILDTKYPQFPYVIRTPSKPGVDAKCAAACPGSGIVFRIGLVQWMTIKPNMGFKVTVPKPWKVLLNAYPNYVCELSLASEGCAVISDNAANVLLLTDDPNAPAVNAILEEVPWPASCP